MRPINLFPEVGWLFWPGVKTRGGWQCAPSDLMTGAHRETDCQRQTEPWGGCNEYAAPYGGDDLINNNKLSLWPGLLGAALYARANGLKSTGHDCQGSQRRLVLDFITQDKLLLTAALTKSWNIIIQPFIAFRLSTLQTAGGTAFTQVDDHTSNRCSCGKPYYCVTQS